MSNSDWLLRQKLIGSTKKEKALWVIVKENYFLLILILILISLLNEKYCYTKNDEFVTIRDKCPKIPPSKSLHFATRVRRSRVVRLNLSSRYMWAAAFKARRSDSCPEHTPSPEHSLYFKTSLFIRPHQQKNLAELGMEIQTALLGYISESGTCSYKLFWGVGGSQLSLLYFLINRSITVHRAYTRQVKNFILSHGTLAKTHNLDAKALAQYGSERCGRLQLFTPISKEQTTLFALCQRRHDVTKTFVQGKKKIAVVLKVNRKILRKF